MYFCIKLMLLYLIPDRDVLFTVLTYMYVHVQGYKDNIIISIVYKVMIVHTMVVFRFGHTSLDSSLAFLRPRDPCRGKRNSLLKYSI